MPTAYALLVGLTEIDDQAPYYSSTLDGFDGRSGCEGVLKDLERMERLTHHLGLHLITGVPLVNQDATAGRVLRALEEAVARLQDGDLFLLYLSCHGMTRGHRSPGTRNPSDPSLTETEYINQFLMYDRPLYNFEILSALQPLSEKVRVVSIIDACHAGLGTGLVAHEEEQAQRAVLRLRQSAPNNSTALFNALLASNVGPAAEPKSANALMTLLVGSGFAPSGRKRTDDSVFNRLGSDAIRSIFSLALDTGKLPSDVAAFADAADLSARLKCRIAHLAASRSRGVAFGSPDGSLFTKQLIRTYMNQAQPGLSYVGMLESLQSSLPPQYPPSAEWYPQLNTDRRLGPIPLPDPGHFAESESFLIL